MTGHLKEKELIEYQFSLASDEQRKRAAVHLESCEKCRAELEWLKNRFSALELLRTDTQVSEELIKTVIEQAKRERSPRVLRLMRKEWVGAAAAMLIVGVLLAIPLFRTTEKREALTKDIHTVEAEKKTGPMETTEAIAAKPERDIVGGEGLSEERLIVKEDKSGWGLDTYFGYKAGDEFIPDEAPFAPASAIELVVLPRRQNVQITVYNSADLTLVRERRELTLKRGWNWLQFMWANTLIDPTSLHLEPLEQKDKIDIEQLVFPARLREVGRWLIRSEVTGKVAFEITYFTSGVNWRAFYMGTLADDEKTMDIAGYVRVDNNSGEDFEDAETRLIVGKVHLLDRIADLARRQYPYGPSYKYRELEGIEAGDVSPWYGNGKVPVLGKVPILGRAFRARKKEIVKEGLSEYFLYTIEGTETIENGWGKRLISFEAGDVNVVSFYKYDEERYGRQTIRYVKFKNDEEHNLGDTPLPNGNVKIYARVGGNGDLRYVGGTNVKYIPVDEEVELNLGAARLVKVEPVLMDFATENFEYNKKGNITGFDEVRKWKVEITNARKLPIEIEVTRGFATAYWNLSIEADGVKYKKHDATHARFELNVEPRSKKAFEYTVRTYHGTREEAQSK